MSTEKPIEKLPRWTWLVMGTALGAACMWLLDPRQGARRRAHVRDKAARFSRSSYDSVFRALRRSKHRLVGLYARSLHKPEVDVDDEKLTSRVRSEFGRKIRHARSISSEVTGGIVTLSGPILKDEVKALLDCVSHVPGVKEVVNHLDIHDVSEGVSALQGKGKAYLQ